MTYHCEHCDLTTAHPILVEGAALCPICTREMIELPPICPDCTWEMEEVPNATGKD